MPVEGTTDLRMSDKHTGRWPLISVIVPTKDSERTIERCLKSVKQQTYKKIETVVVDALSRDNTRIIASEFGARILTSNSKRSEARNIGMQTCEGDYVLFVDSDMELETSVIEGCVKEIRRGYHVIIVPESSIGVGFWAKCKALEKSLYVGDSSIEAARLFRKDILERFRGYDPGLEAGEDWDLTCRARRAGYKIGRTNSFIVHNEGKLSLRETVIKKSYYGKTLMYYRSKHPEEARQQLKIIRPAFIRNWRKLAHDPIHATGLLLMKACEYISYKISYVATPTRIVSPRLREQNLCTKGLSRPEKIQG